MSGKEGQKDDYTMARQRGQHMQKPGIGTAENMFVKICGWNIECW